ncbi:Low-density lipoprotein (LDL) receptor class A repeat and Insulin-like growth factor binding protein,N-terminal domain-containing protein [Strongyloides ratti]|uniref:Low-density lipoprotein (LDL) receptor class A repeat and Insulin-like growth factor binding protein,N-terminal domain-containing protein n=1 Tax=Strongyloides ratti TaxID=34506 RepID=A0A090MNW5_STRRB|nr:Low-density lipoprotein (LDL) receptor class A repeat and Insulin-like growth factor binding protein,N-terminal domain-containing protein [Strongyloides ratti]CEF59756.1 Low-density lipoprotein (LDL) receptor class A repeat and Insulin-like growth factor binding protein,N-terminal domain-containing protein [Strongyloides ratti]
MLSNNYNILKFINLLIILKTSNSQWLSIISFKSRFSLPCVNNTFHCGDGKCIPMNKIHDTYNDCSDGSDECKLKKINLFLLFLTKLVCFPGYIKCGKICVETTNADNCFGFDNCYKSKIIPKFCPYLKQKLCNANGTFHCKGYGECIFTEWMFDKKQDCYDGSDLDPEYVSIFKKILNNQYPEELLYHLNNKEKISSSFNTTNNLNNFTSTNFLWPNNIILPQNKEILTPTKSKISYSNKKPIQPVEGLELMNKPTFDKVSLMFPTLIPYQITKSQTDYTEESLTSLDIKSTTIKTSLLPIIYPFTSMNKNVDGHLQTTKGINFFNTSNSTNIKIGDEELEKNINISGTTKKNISLDNHLEIFKENTTSPLDIFIGKTTNKTNESYNYPKIVVPIDKISKENIKIDDNINDTYLNDIFGDEKLITNDDKTSQTSFPFKESFKEEKLIKGKTLSSNIINIPQTTQSYLKLNEIENKGYHYNLFTTTISSHENTLSDQLIENNNFYTSTTKLDKNNNVLTSNKDIPMTKSIYQTPNKITTIEYTNTLTTIKEVTMENSQTKEIDVNETIPQNIINKNEYGSSFTTQQPNIEKNNKNKVKFLTTKSVNSNNLENKFDFLNLDKMGKHSNIPQNWNFFGIPRTEIGENFYPKNKLSTQSPKIIFKERIFEKTKDIEEVNNDNSIKIKITTMNKDNIITTTPLTLDIPKDDVKNTTEMIHFNIPNEEKQININNSNYNSNTITTLDNIVDLKNISSDNDRTNTTSKSFIKNNMTNDEYNKCIKKFMSENFYHYDTNGESICQCGPGDSPGFLGVCQHKLHSVILKLNIESICGNVPSKDINNKIKSGIISLLKNEDDIDDACFRLSKENNLIAEIFCKKCSLSSIENIFQFNNMESKYNSKLSFTPGGNDACNNSELNFCDKNATCIPMNDKYECICDSKNNFKLEKFNTDYGRNCYSNDHCDTLFGICIIYWLLLIPFILLMISCLCCLLHRLCLNYDIYCCSNQRFQNLIPFYVKHKNRRKSKNVVIEDIKEAQKWHPDNKRPSSIHSTDDYQLNSRRKSAILFNEDDYVPKKSPKSQTNSIHSVEDYMIVDSETEDQKNSIVPIINTQATIHNEQKDRIEKINVDNGKVVQTKFLPIEHYKSQPILENTHKNPNFYSLTDINSTVNSNQFLDQNNLKIFKKNLSKENILASNVSKDIKHSTTVQTIHSSLENISSNQNIKINKVNSDSNLKMFLEKAMDVDETFNNENTHFDTEKQSMKSGKTVHSKNSSCSLLSSHPIIEEEEDERNENTSTKKSISLEQCFDNALTYDKKNNSVKSLPYINNNSSNHSMINVNLQSIPKVEYKQKHIFKKRTASSATLFQHTENDSSNSKTNLSSRASSLSIEPSTKDFQFDSTHETVSDNLHQNDNETIWEHYKHHTELPEVVQTDSMNELDRLFSERLKISSQIKDTHLTNVSQTPNVENITELSKQKKETSDIKNKVINVKDNSENPKETLATKKNHMSEDVKITEAKKVENMIDDITNISNYNFKEDHTFKNTVVSDSDLKMIVNNKNFDKPNNVIENVSNNYPNIDNDSKCIKPTEDVIKQEISKIENNKLNKEEKKLKNIPKTIVKISKPSLIDKKKVMSYSILKDDKNNKRLNFKVEKEDKNLNESKHKRITLKPPIPKFTNLKLPSSSVVINGPQSSRSVQERKKNVTSPIARSSSFNFNKSSMLKTGLKIKPSEIKIEEKLPVHVKVKLPKIDKSPKKYFDKEKLISHNKNEKLPLLNVESESFSKFKDHSKNNSPPKNNLTNSDIVKERIKEKEEVTFEKSKYDSFQKKENTFNKFPTDIKYNELNNLKNIVPEKNLKSSDREKKGIPNVKITIKKKGKIVNENDVLCGVCKDDIIKIIPNDIDEEQLKKNKIKSFIKQQEKAGILVKNPKTHKLAVIKEKSEEYKNVKIKEPSKIDYNKNNFELDFDETLSTQRTSNFEISRENSLIPVHFDSRYVGPPSARESARILEAEGNYYAGDVDLDMPSPYILPITESDIKNCIFNNNELRKLKTNIPFLDWDHHSEIIKRENLKNQKLNHSMSESNLQKKLRTTKNSKGKEIYDFHDNDNNTNWKNKSRSHSPSTFNKNIYKNKEYIKQKSNVIINNKDSIYREQSNVSISSSGGYEHWNLSYIHEGDIKKIPLPPLSYSYRALNSKQRRV